MSEPPGRPGAERRDRRPRGSLTILVIAGLATALLFVFSSSRTSTKEIPWAEFTARLKAGEVDKLVLLREKWNMEGTWKSAAEGEKGFFVRLPSGRLITADFIEKSILPNVGSFKTKDPSRFWELILGLVPWIILIGFFWFIFLRQARGPVGPTGVLSFGKSRARMHSREHVNVTFDDVAGIEEAKEEVQEIVAFLKNPSRFQRLGGRVPKGVLLVGPPGTGKTLLAKAIAGEADVPFFSISGSDFVEMFVGVGASRVRDLFKQTRETSPCIVFLDEIDAVGRRRGAGLGGGHDEREQTLNAILVEMDGFETDQGIIILAATNRPDILDPALLRPGRFDRQIVVDMPDVRGREAILKVHARNVKLGPDTDLRVMARSTPTFSGADLEAMINEAALIATLKNKDWVEMDDLEEARDKVKWGREKKSRVLEEEDRRITAYHEAGHALVAHHLPDAEPLHKVTIIPRGMTLGSTMQLPERDRYHISRRRVLAMITVLFAGRIAEEIFCDDITSGAQNDIENATTLARRMVNEWGMSDRIGPVNYRDGQEHLFLGHEVTRTRHHSEKTAIEIDEEVKRIITDCYENARAILTDHGPETEALAEALLEYESLNAEEARAVLRGDTVEAVRKAVEKRGRGTASPRPDPAAGPAAEGAAPDDDTDDLETKGRFAY